MKLEGLIKSKWNFISGCIFNLQMVGENSEPIILRSFSKESLQSVFELTPTTRELVEDDIKL